MTNYSYSARSNKFYPEALKPQYEQNGTWPADAKEVDEDVVREYNGVPPEGKVRASDKNGNPSWVDAPPPDSDMLIEMAENEKIIRVSMANERIRILEYAISLNMATEDEKEIYDEWRKYAVLVSRVDTSSPSWPNPPGV